MRTVNLQTDIPENRELRIHLPPDFPTGPAEVQIAEVVPRTPSKTYTDFLRSEFAGMWRDRADIVDSSEFATRLRESAWDRSR